jgi:hypothetical protein
LSGTKPDAFAPEVPDVVELHISFLSAHFITSTTPLSGTLVTTYQYDDANHLTSRV